MNFSKHLTDWFGVGTVELCGRKKRDLGGILRYVWAQKWGSGDLLLPPPPWKVGGASTPCPPCSYAYVYGIVPCRCTCMHSCTETEGIYYSPLCTWNRISWLFRPTITIFVYVTITATWWMSLIHVLHLSFSFFILCYQSEVLQKTWRARQIPPKCRCASVR